MSSLDRQLHRLAIDSGMDKDTSKYDLFTMCAKAILDAGSVFSSETMNMIRTTCEASRSRLADELLDEIDRIEPKPTRKRPTQRSTTKWWESYEPKQTKKRPMSPLFKSNSHIPEWRSSTPQRSRKRRRR